MSESKNQYNLGQFKVDGIVTIGGEHYGDKVGIQHNYPTEQKQTLAEAAKEIQDLLNQLAQNNPVNTDYEKQVLVNQFNEEVKTNSRIRGMLLAGGFELIKILCPLAGIPIEMGRKWLETAEKTNLSK